MPSLRELSDQLVIALAHQKALDKQAADQKEVVDNLKDAIICEMKELDLTSMTLPAARINLLKQTKPNVVEWDKLYSFIHQHTAFDLLHKRLSSTAWSDRLENGEDIPGITTFETTIIRVTKS